jgi:hypothetical protein
LWPAIGRWCFGAAHECVGRLTSGDVETYGSVDAANFGIDLIAADAARRELAKYVDHGTRVTPQKTGRY